MIHLKKILFVCLCGAALSQYATAVDNIPISPIINNPSIIPSVPVSVAKANLSSVPSQGSGSKLVINNDTQVIVRPGVNEILSISRGYMNRIVTPYSRPKVIATEEKAVTVKDNVLYVVTEEEAPLSLFITEGDSQEEALSLTLIPQGIPGREITLRSPGNQVNQGTPNLVAEKWEKSQPYLSTIEELLRTLALGKIPTGYKFQSASDDSVPLCRQTGLNANFRTGQMLIGHNLTVYIGVLSNTTDRPIEFSEESCGNWDVAAVSAFPSHTISPGKKTEVYVVKKRQSLKELQPKRPSLISAGEF